VDLFILLVIFLEFGLASDARASHRTGN
jgi:hypothetical protein